MHDKLPSSKNTFGEAMLALGGLVGFVALLWQGKVQNWYDIWIFTAILGIVAVFYWLLLLVRATFTFMTGGDSFWWEKYQDQYAAPKKKKPAVMKSETPTV